MKPWSHLYADGERWWYFDGTWLAHHTERSICTNCGEENWLMRLRMANEIQCKYGLRSVYNWTYYYYWLKTKYKIPLLVTQQTKLDTIRGRFLQVQKQSARCFCVCKRCLDQELHCTRISQYSTGWNSVQMWCALLSCTVLNTRHIIFNSS